MTKGQCLQEPFLNFLRCNKASVSIFLVNGIKLQGVIESFDQFVIMLKNNKDKPLKNNEDKPLKSDKDKLVSQQMVYKHAISTIVPKDEVSPFSCNRRASNHHESLSTRRQPLLNDSDDGK